MASSTKFDGFQSGQVPWYDGIYFQVTGSTSSGQESTCNCIKLNKRISSFIKYYKISA